jgi:anti-sigma regulatory factor (Ser/Thr protein kinase)
VRQLLEDEGAAGEALDNLELALSEALMNAFEHGCLGMGADKQRLMLEGGYDDLVMAAEPDEHKQISLTLTLLSRQGRLQVWLEVVDPGPGFHQEQGIAQCRSAAVPCGRGFMMMQRSVDLVRRNSVGNRVVLMQLFDGSTPPPPFDS